MGVCQIVRKSCTELLVSYHRGSRPMGNLSVAGFRTAQRYKPILTSLARSTLKEGS